MWILAKKQSNWQSIKGISPQTNLHKIDGHLFSTRHHTKTCQCKLNDASVANKIYVQRRQTLRSILRKIFRNKCSTENVQRKNSSKDLERYNYCRHTLSFNELNPRNVEIISKLNSLHVKRHNSRVYNGAWFGRAAVIHNDDLTTWQTTRVVTMLLVKLIVISNTCSLLHCTQCSLALSACICLSLPQFVCLYLSLAASVCLFVSAKVNGVSLLKNWLCTFELKKTTPAGKKLNDIKKVRRILLPEEPHYLHKKFSIIAEKVGLYLIIAE